MKVLEIKDFMPFGDIFLLGLASVLNPLRSFLLLKVGSFLLSLYEELLSTMFERLLGSSGIVAGEVVPETQSCKFLSKFHRYLLWY